MYPDEFALGPKGFPEGLRYTLVSQELDPNLKNTNEKMYKEILDGAYDLTYDQTEEGIAQMMKEGLLHTSVVGQLALRSKNDKPELYLKLTRAIEIFNN